MKKVVYVVNSTFHILYSIFLAQHLGDTCEHRMIVNFPTGFRAPVEFLPEGLFSQVIMAEDPQLTDSGLTNYKIELRCYGRLFASSEPYKAVADCGAEDVLVMFHDRMRIPQKIGRIFAKRGGRIVLAEDGLALYEMRTYPPKSFKFKVIDGILGVCDAPYVGASSFITDVFAGMPEQVPEPVRRGRNLVQRSDIFLDEELLPDLVKQAESMLELKDGKRCLWIGNPTEEDGIGTAKPELLDQIVRSLPEVQFLLKPHPRERADKYASLIKYDNVTMVDLKELSWLPVELLARAIKPSILLSQMSTALLNVKQYLPESTALYGYKLWELDIREPLKTMLETMPGITVAESMEELLERLKAAPEQVIFAADRRDRMEDVEAIRG